VIWLSVFGLVAFFIAPSAGYAAFIRPRTLRRKLGRRHEPLFTFVVFCRFAPETRRPPFCRRAGDLPATSDRACLVAAAIPACGGGCRCLFQKPPDGARPRLNEKTGAPRCQAAFKNSGSSKGGLCGHAVLCLPLRGTTNASGIVDCQVWTEPSVHFDNQPRTDR